MFAVAMAIFRGTMRELKSREVRGKARRMRGENSRVEKGVLNATKSLANDSPRPSWQLSSV